MELSKREKDLGREVFKKKKKKKELEDEAVRGGGGSSIWIGTGGRGGLGCRCGRKRSQLRKRFVTTISQTR